MTSPLRPLQPVSSKLILVFFLLLLSQYGRAQTWESAQAVGTSEYNGQAQYSQTITDGAGHLYVTGGFQGVISLGNRTLSSREFTQFVAKLDASTGECLWALTTAAGIYDMAVDAGGNLTVAGAFTARNITLGTTTLLNTSSGLYGSDLFVAKLSSSGQWLGAYQASGPGSKQVNTIDVDAAGNIYVAGRLGTSATFGTTTLTSAGDGIFMAKLSATGQWQWAVTGGSSKNNYTNGLQVDAGGNAYVTGQFFGATATFGSFTLTNTSNVAGSGSAEIFVVKLNAAGQWQWATRGGGYDHDNVSSLALDASGNVYVAGSFQGYTTSFGSTMLNNAGEVDGFVAKLNNAGQWQWATRVAGSANESVNNLAVDASGSIYLSGSTSSRQASFGSITVTNSAQATSAIASYAAQLTSSGQWQWATASGGQANTTCTGLAVDAANHVFLTGDYEGGNVTFGTTTLRNSGSSDLFVARLSTSGQWQWAMNSNGGGSSTVSSTAVDAAGNVYVAGSFTGSLSFGSTTLRSNNNNDLFVAKRNAAGQWLWLTQAAGAARYGMGYYYYEKQSIAVDASGNVYLTGSFRGPDATFGPTTLSSSAGGTYGYDVFVAKLNSSGQWQWATQASGTHDDYSSGIAVEPGGNVYLTGSFHSTDLRLGSTTLTNPGQEGIPEIFAAKLTPDGQWLWAKRAGGTSYDNGSDITTDAAGNAYVSGTMQSTSASFGSITLTNPGYANAYVAKLSPTGEWLWATRGGDGYAGASGIAADAAGNSYVTGYFGGQAEFGSLLLNSTDSSDVFVAKLNTAGQWQWATQGGNRGSNQGNDIAVDASGSAYVTGSFRSAGAIFGATTLPYSHRSYYDTFVAKLTPAGSWQWATSAGGVSFTGSISLDGTGSAYVGGQFSGYYGDVQATFGPHTLTTAAYVHPVGFLARLSGTVSSARTPSTALELAQAVPNPFASTLSLQLRATQPGLVELTAHDATGRQWLHQQMRLGAAQTTLNLPAAANWPAGVYLLTIRQGQSHQVLKVVRQ
jgi:hypothetical protein